MNEKRCNAKCVVLESDICCYDCKISEECKLQCPTFKSNISFDNCFFKIIDLNKTDPHAIIATGVLFRLPILRGVYRSPEDQEEIEEKLTEKIKNWFRENVSWRFHKDRPEDC
jgi:coenzyme F420-reducing hydrogenase gamma subunit